MVKEFKEIEKIETPEGDGNKVLYHNKVHIFIEKIETPEGDGNTVDAIII